jgi:ParB family transcriptional regulator, chromosome partitioning protein
LLSLATPLAQLAALQTILSQDLNVRQTEDLVRRLGGERPQKTSPPSPEPEISALQDQLERKLGTRVQLLKRGSKGNIRIFYYSEEELNTLVDRLLGSL